MRNKNCRPGTEYLMTTMILSQGISLGALAHAGPVHNDGRYQKIPNAPSCQLLTADRLFDGVELLTDAAVLIQKAKVVKVGLLKDIKKRHTAINSTWATRQLCLDVSNHTRI